MPKSFLRIVVLGAVASFPANAADKGIANQNAFTRAVKEPLSGIVTLVPNPKNTPCNSVVECRRNRNDLPGVWQLNTPMDHSPRDYPANCYVPGEGGKYVYSAASCR